MLYFTKKMKLFSIIFTLLPIVCASQLVITETTDLVSGKTMEQSSALSMSSTSGKHVAELFVQRGFDDKVHLILDLKKPGGVAFDTGELVSIELIDGTIIEAFSCNGYNRDGRLIVQISGHGLTGGRLSDLQTSEIVRLSTTSMGRKFTFHPNRIQAINIQKAIKEVGCE